MPIALRAARAEQRRAIATLHETFRSTSVVAGTIPCVARGLWCDFVRACRGPTRRAAQTLMPPTFRGPGAGAKECAAN
jgi:hypothetical protein